MTFKLGKPLILISAVRESDKTYMKDFIQIIKFDIEFAKSIIGHDNVIVIADRQTMPYLDGRKATLVDGLSLPIENLLEFSIEDIWIRDFGLIGMHNPCKFRYHPKSLSKSDSKAIEKSFLKFLSSFDVEVDYAKPGQQDAIVRKSSSVDPSGADPIWIPYFDDYSLDGGNVVDDHFDKAIVTDRFMTDNKIKSVVECEKILQNALGIPNVCIVPCAGSFEEDPTGHSDGMCTFLDKWNLGMADLEDEDLNSEFKRWIENTFQPPNTVNTFQMEGSYCEEQDDSGYPSACGLYVNSLVTDDFIYLPVYGADRENQNRGATIEKDQKAKILIESKTSKPVIPVSVPWSVCRYGGSVRCLSMQVCGSVADRIMIRSMAE